MSMSMQLKERTYRYTLENEEGTRVNFAARAFSFQRMLARIENDFDLDVWRIVEIREMKR